MTSTQSSSAERGGIGTQTLALVVDAYRELNSKKLFWITLVLSLLVVIAFAFVGIDGQGVTVFGAKFPGAWNTNVIPAETFYKFIFTEIAIPWWLGLIASILALVSVCGVFPDFLAGGSIDLYLSRPIGRLRLFLTKYLTSLLFVAVQVAIFAIGSFLLIGIRGGKWEPRIFLAIPLVTLFFSYLFCVCVLVGIVTRSALAALLLTVLFWLLLFSLNTTDQALLLLKTSAEQRVANQKSAMAVQQKVIDSNNTLPPDKRGDVRAFEFQRDNLQGKLVEYQSTVNQLTWWYNLIGMVRAPFPRTAETVELMPRWLVEPEPLLRAEREAAQQREKRRAARRAEAGLPPPTTEQSERLEPHDVEVEQEAKRVLRERPAWMLIGSSLAFEAVVLGLAAWIFCRRDF